MEIKDLKYEEAFLKLEDIVNKLSKEDIQLDESIKLFKEGNELLNHCSKLLEEAENIVTTIVETDTGVEEVSFQLEE